MLGKAKKHDAVNSGCMKKQQKKQNHWEDKFRPNISEKAEVVIYARKLLTELRGGIRGKKEQKIKVKCGNRMEQDPKKRNGTGGSAH